MCQINIVGDVPFPVGNYTNIDQSAIKKPELVETIIYSDCNIKSKILLWQKPIQYSILYAVRFHKTVTMFFLKKQYDRKLYILYSHCSIVHSVRFGSGQFNFFFRVKCPWSLLLSSLVFLFLPLFTSALFVERTGSLRTAGFSARSKHFSRRLSSFPGPVKMYSQGTSMPNPPPLFTAFPRTLTIPLAPGFARKCRKSPTPFVVLANLNGTCPTTRLFLTTETAFLSFGFSGSGTSCKVSPFLGVHHPWYTWNPLIHERKLADWLLAMSCSVFYWTKTFRNLIPLVASTRER